MKRATPLLVVAVVGAGIIIGTLVRPLAARMDATPPQIGWGPATMLFTFALLIAAMAWNTWQSLHKKHERMTSDHGVKMLALSRSSLIVGGLFGGGYGGYALSFVPDLDTPLGAARVWHAGGAAVAGLLLIVAALLLERACHIPGGDDEDPEPNGAAASAA
ncbi:MAG TPA: DUF3180 family protein [Aeromicrobium sp.]|jgi:hypothetical protein|nr:DUF3180 family protein [Aeromicrobium sp.]HKY58685.1 DUF3180 family protein [Aeromicrobium sp.]